MELFIVGTPIGNLEDITFRAVRVLQEADIVYCEDTRITRRLFDRYDITTHLESLNARTEHAKIASVIERLNDGKKVAYVSDAGTPTISDPGSRLVSEVRKELPEVTVTAIPGPSAVTAALSISGLPASDFLFLGFLPHKKGRETLLKKVQVSEHTVVLYESPHRIMKTLEWFSTNLEASRTLSVARELTKIHEEVVFGSAQEVFSHFERNPQTVKGEFVVMVSKA